jgi:hypothetical protein
MYHTCNDFGHRHRHRLASWTDLKWQLKMKMVVRHCVPETATCVDDHRTVETQSTLLGCRSRLSWSLIGWHSSYRRRGNEDLRMLAHGSSWRMSQPMRGSESQSQSLSGDVGRQIAAHGCRDSCRRIKRSAFFFWMVVVLCRSVVGIHKREQTEANKVASVSICSMVSGIVRDRPDCGLGTERRDSLSN